MAAAVYDNAKSSFERDPGKTDRDDFGTDVLFASSGRWAFGGGHRRVILNVDGIEPQTNGYLHTFFAVAHRLGAHKNGGIRFSIAPALSASSNITKDPDEYTADALQLLAALVWDREIIDRLKIRYGLCGDHRFGEYRVYPVIGMDWRAHPDWTVEIGFPLAVTLRNNGTPRHDTRHRTERQSVVRKGPA